MNIFAGPGVAIREFPLSTGAADYLLYVDGKAIGVVEAKSEGHPLTGVETQSDKYLRGLPNNLPHYRLPLPFAYESTGSESRFSNYLEPDARSRSVFTFHRPEELLRLVKLDTQVRAALREMPELNVEGLWPLKITTINNLERSLAENRPRSLVQMNEQRRIVEKIEELFSNLDAGVAALERARANLKRYRASVLKAAVAGALTADWRAKHPKVEPATKLLERILTERRKKWEADQLTKFAAAGKQPSTNGRAKYVEPKRPDTANLPQKRHLRKPTWDAEKNPDGCWRSFDYEELMKRDKVNLDIFWLRDKSLEDSDDLPSQTSSPKKSPTTSRPRSNSSPPSRKS